VVLEAPEMGDEVQAIKAGLLEVADIVVVNKGDRPGAQRTAAQLRAMLVPTVARADRDPERPAPKRPDVLVTTAATGDGIPELLATLDRHRAAGAETATTDARLARAEAQVTAVLGARIRQRLGAADHAAATREVYGAVARHELDPYAGADRLLALLDD
jgi:LAO/AO transport system kinase